MNFKKQVLFQSLLIIVLFIAKSQTKDQSNSTDIVDESWGLFKPHLLFCLTQRSLNPINFGLIYTNYNKHGKKLNPRQNLRWKFGNTKDKMFVDYIANNGNDFAQQKLVDQEILVDMEISFIKNEDQQWGVNLKVTNQQSKYDGMIVYLYLTASTYEDKQIFTKRFFVDAFEEGKPIKLEIEHRKRNSLSDFLEIIEDTKEGEPSQFELKLLQTRLDEAWNMQQILKDNLDSNGKLEDSIKLQQNINNNQDDQDEQNSCGQIQGGTIRNCKRDKKQSSSSSQSSSKNKEFNNVAILKIQNSQRNELNFFIRFTNSTKIEQQYKAQQQSENENSNKKQKNNQGLVDLSYFNDIQSFEKLIKIKKDKFKLDLKQKFGYEKEDLIQSVISNLLGGLVFYHGKVAVRNSLMKNNQYKTVFSASPSRKIFPRAFLWDEGFHDIIICMWNEQLCKSFISSWMNNQDVFGYISREQVRTSEIANMVPDGFRSQDAYEANPPTLLFPILQLSQNRKNIPFIKTQFRKLEKWFKWFTKTQSGLDFHNRNKINRIMLNEQLSPHYRWQCKGYCNDGNFMGSGLDDYPRQDPFTISKQHLDLQCWMIFFAESLETLSQRVSNKVKQNQYGQFKKLLKDQLQSEFLDQKQQLYKDIGANQFNHTIDQYVTHLGYITLYPLIFNATQINSTEFQQTLDLLYSKEHLWTDFGIRSLSLKDPLQETGDNYWRGAIWMPLNFLILRSLKLNYFQNERVRTIYHELRDNLIQNIYKNWKQTGYIFETYNPKTGQGQRGFPFNGWTSLIVLIIKQDYE